MSPPYIGQFSTLSTICFNFWRSNYRFRNRSPISTSLVREMYYAVGNEAVTLFSKSSQCHGALGNRTTMTIVMS